MCTKLFFTLLLSSFSLGAMAGFPYVISKDDHEVVDSKTGLIWRRCPEGMAASATACTGVASTFTNETALLHAKAQSILSGLSWRLPNVKELSSIADKNRLSPAIDSAAFPSTPLSGFWSSTPYLPSITNNAWVVNFAEGDVYPNTRIWAEHVRLVRSDR